MRKPNLTDHIKETPRAIWEPGCEDTLAVLTDIPPEIWGMLSEREKLIVSAYILGRRVGEKERTCHVAKSGGDGLSKATKAKEWRAVAASLWMIMKESMLKNEAAPMIAAKVHKSARTVRDYLKTID